MRALDTIAHEILFHGELFEYIFESEKRLASNLEAGGDHDSSDVQNSPYEKHILDILRHGRDTLGGMDNYTDEILIQYFKDL